jgi:DNA modification methylase
MPAVALDPFGGSGTLGQVALEEGRSAVLIEIAEHYLPMIAKRCRMNGASGGAATCTVKPARAAGEEPGGDE